MEVLVVYLVFALIILPGIMSIGWTVQHVIRAFSRGVKDGLDDKGNS